MGNYYSIDHIADDHTHTDITCYIEEPQQKYRLGTVSNRLLDHDLRGRTQASACMLYSCCIYSNKLCDYA